MLTISILLHSIGIFSLKLYKRNVKKIIVKHLVGSEKPSSIRLKLPPVWFDMFKNMDSNFEEPSLLMLYERGYVLHTLRDRFSGDLENQPQNKEIFNLYDKFMRHFVIPHKNDDGYSFQICETFNEKYDLIDKLVLDSKSVWKTFPIPKILKEFLSALSRKLGVTPTNLVIDCVCSGLAVLDFTIYMEKHVENYSNYIVRHLRELANSRLLGLKIDNGEYYVNVGKV